MKITVKLTNQDGIETTTTHLSQTEEDAILQACAKRYKTKRIGLFPRPGYKNEFTPVKTLKYDIIYLDGYVKAEII